MVNRNSKHFDTPLYLLLFSKGNIWQNIYFIIKYFKTGQQWGRERERNVVVELILQMNVCTSGRCAAVLDVFRSLAYVIENWEEKTCMCINTRRRTHARKLTIHSFQKFTLNFVFKKKKRAYTNVPIEFGREPQNVQKKRRVGEWETHSRIELGSAHIVEIFSILTPCQWLIKKIYTRMNGSNEKYQMEYNVNHNLIWSYILQKPK